MWRCVLVLAALSSVAQANVPSLRIGSATDATVSSVALAIDGRIATLTLQLTTLVRDPHEIVLDLDMPHGAAVTGMAMVQGRERTDATWLSPGRARDQYDSTVQREVDPALLEQAGDRDHLLLHVFPVAKVAPVTIDLVLELPASDALVIEPEAELPRVEIVVGAKHVVWRRLRAARRIELPPGEAHGYDPLQIHVDAHRSLVAEPLAPATVGALPGGPPGLRSAKEISDVVRAGAASLAACGDVEPHAIVFVIAKDGRVTSASAGNRCIEAAIRAWTFPAASEATRVAYPLSWYVASGT
jgi:hypothetical protein